LSDEDLRDEALRAFAEKARAKFDAGIAEHNPDGSRGLGKMSYEQHLDAIADEIMDLWFYLYSLKVNEKFTKKLTHT